MIHVFRIMPKVILKMTHAHCDSKESISRFFRRAENGTSWVGKALWLPCWLTKKASSFPSKNLRTSCCCRMKLDTCEGIWLPSTWLKSSRVFSVAIPLLVSTSKLRLLSVFYNIRRSFQSCKSCYYGFIQVNVNIEMRQALQYSVDSQCLRLFRRIDLIAHTGLEWNFAKLKFPFLP